MVESRTMNLSSSNNFPSCYLIVLLHCFMKEKRGKGGFSTAGFRTGAMGEQTLVR